MKLQIIVRSANERTEKACIDSASKQGDVHVIRAVPFGEAIRQTYALASEFQQEWTPVVDADVILSDGSLRAGIEDLNRQYNRNTIFCLDGKTKDKIFIKARRAGIHIYRTKFLKYASRFIDDKKIKPESYVRKQMENLRFPTYTGRIIFGKHDYEQYYKDLWRKSVVQVYKLAGIIKKGDIINKWRRKAETDFDYKIILAGHEHGKKLLKENVYIDASQDWGWSEYAEKNGIIEKEALR